MTSIADQLELLYAQSDIAFIVVLLLAVHF